MQPARLKIGTRLRHNDGRTGTVLRRIASTDRAWSVEVDGTKSRVHWWASEVEPLKPARRRVIHARPAMHGHKPHAPYGLCGWRAPKGGTVAITDAPSEVTCKRCLTKLAALGGSMRSAS